MVFNVRPGARRNILPIQLETSKVSALEGLPSPQPVHAVFEPVMIPGHRGEESQEEEEGAITGLVPAEPIQHDANDETSAKNEKTPTREPIACCAPMTEAALQPPKQSLEQLFPEWYLYGGRRTGHDAWDDTGCGEWRQHSVIFRRGSWLHQMRSDWVDVTVLLGRWGTG